MDFHALLFPPCPSLILLQFCVLLFLSLLAPAASSLHTFACHHKKVYWIFQQSLISMEGIPVDWLFRHQQHQPSSRAAICYFTWEGTGEAMSEAPRIQFKNFVYAQGEVCSIRVAFYQMLQEGQPIRLTQGWCLNFQLPYCRLLICCISAADRLYLSAQICAHKSFDISWIKSIPVHIKCFICKVWAENLNEMSPRLLKMILHSWRIKHGVSLIATEGRWTRFFYSSPLNFTDWTLLKCLAL